MKGSNGNNLEYIRVIPPIERIFEENGKKVKKKVGQQKYTIREKVKDEDGNIIQPEDVRYVDGIIIGKKVLTMRTDGIIVEALLGQANALDNYSLEARKEKIRQERIENNLNEVNIQKILAGVNLVNTLVEDKNFDKAITAYKEVFGVQEGMKYLIEVINNLKLKPDSRME